MVGRTEEKKVLDKILAKKKSSFLAITGRRRIGKTYLVDNYYKEKICFRITGIQDATQVEQMNNFVLKLSEYSGSLVGIAPKNWQEVFVMFKNYLVSLSKKTKQVIFIDELPWIATARTSFLKLLAHLWNDFLSKENHFVLVVCGSSSSWLTQKILNDKGGLHNRVTDVINLQAFNLQETKLFLKSLSIHLSHQEISKLYMCLGGIPYYLEQIRKGESVAVAIERICFSEQGVLKREYDNLYKALFRNAENHEELIEILAKKPSGWTRKEIIVNTRIPKGGTLNRTIGELLDSGFISEFTPFGNKKRGVQYRLNDEFSIFYHQFMKKNKKYTKGIWLQIAASQKYKIWCGYAFENLCLKHIDNLKSALGISAVYTEISSLNIAGTKTEKGYQIDLIIDRKDNTINLMEMKYYEGKFKIDKKYAETLRERRMRFIENTKTKKQVFNTLVTNYGVLQNEHYNDVIDSEIVLEELF